MKKINLVAAIALAISATSSQAVVLNFGNSTTDAVQGTDFNFANCNAIDFAAGAEFRMCDPSNVALGGGLPLQKDTINGTESWAFNRNGVLTDVVNTGTASALSETTIYYLGDSISDVADPAGGLALDQGDDYFGINLSFLAPTLGSSAGNLYGEGVYSATGETSFEIFFPVLEGRWGGDFASLGSYNNAGVTFFGSLDGNNFTMWAEHQINFREDFSGAIEGTAQWYYVGTIDGFVPPSAVPVPAAVWLFGSGLLGLAGVARRRKML